MRLKRYELEELGETVRVLAKQYSTKGKGELPTDRLLFGYLKGAHPRAQLRRQFPQTRTENGRRTVKKIDFHLGSKSAGTYIELVVRKSGEEWRRSPNTAELNKLCRIKSKQAQRSLLIIDVSNRPPLEKDTLKAEYDGWKPTRGRFQRNNVLLTYVSVNEALSFTLRIAKGVVAARA